MMSTDKIMHFVYFETILDSDQFITKWENYLRSENSDAEVVLQESKKNNLCVYVAQHSCDSDEFHFSFTKAAKANRSKETEIKKIQLGGYSILQAEHTGDARKNENKVFVFLNYSNKDFDQYKQAAMHGKLNIYEAYYENCVYAYILEYFVNNSYIPELCEQLHKYSAAEISVYKQHNFKAVR